MLHDFSRILGIVGEPSNLFVLVLALGAVLFVFGARRWGSTLVALAAIVAVAATILPLGEWASEPLEARFPQPSLPDHVDGIIVLGGAISLPRTLAHGEVALNDAAERLTQTIALARRYPNASVLITGGDPGVVLSGITEAAATERLFADVGLDPHRMQLEDRSRDTYENAVYSKDVAKPKPGQVWLLVTSANHMPRAVGCFRHVDWPVVPYPVDYTAIPGARWGGNFAGQLHLLGIAAHEWVGLVAYRLLGRTDTLFPAPDAASATTAR